MKKIILLATLACVGCSIDLNNPNGTGGGENSTSNIPQCIPENNCATIGAECGVVDDGCGNLLDCGKCDFDKYQTFCGGQKLVGEHFSPPQNNICGGGCGIVANSDICARFVGKVTWACDTHIVPTNPIPPAKNCQMLDLYTWCCSN
jgi:hypothetical protein